MLNNKTCDYDYVHWLMMKAHNEQGIIVLLQQMPKACSHILYLQKLGLLVYAYSDDLASMNSGSLDGYDVITYVDNIELLTSYVDDEPGRRHGMNFYPQMHITELGERFITVFQTLQHLHDIIRIARRDHILDLTPASAIVLAGRSLRSDSHLAAPMQSYRYFDYIILVFRRYRDASIQYMHATNHDSLSRFGRVYSAVKYELLGVLAAHIDMLSTWDDEHDDGMWARPNMGDSCVGSEAVLSDIEFLYEFVASQDTDPWYDLRASKRIS